MPSKLPSVILVREQKDADGDKYLVADYNVERVMTDQDEVTVVGTYKLVETRRLVKRVQEVQAARHA